MKYSFIDYHTDRSITYEPSSAVLRRSHGFTDEARANALQKKLDEAEVFISLIVASYTDLFDQAEEDAEWCASYR